MEAINLAKIKETTEQGGAIFKHIQETFAKKENPLVAFNNTEGYTCYLFVSELTVKTVREKLLSKQNEIDFYKRQEIR